MPTDDCKETTELVDETLRAFGVRALTDGGGWTVVRSAADAVGDRIGERQAEEESVEGRSMVVRWAYPFFFFFLFFN